MRIAVRRGRCGAVWRCVVWRFVVRHSAMRCDALRCGPECGNFGILVRVRVGWRVGLVGCVLWDRVDRGRVGIELRWLMVRGGCLVGRRTKEEAGRYLETYRAFENKQADMIQRQATHKTHAPQLASASSSRHARNIQSA